MTVRVSPIMEPAIRPVAQFLAKHMHGGISADAWAQAMNVPWNPPASNHGFMLLDGEDVVGAYLAFYSSRVIDGSAEQLCNLGTWCVLPDYRLHSLRLTKSLLDQPGFHFTDLSPGPGVAKLNSRLGFQTLDSTITEMRALPWPSLPRGVVISSASDIIEQTLTGVDLAIYRDHRDAAAAHHLVIRAGSESCHVVYRKGSPGRIRKVPFVWILHVSNRSLFVKSARHVARHLLIRHGALAVRAELRVVGAPLRPTSVRQIPHIRRMYKSPYLRPDQIDYLYSELCCVQW